MPLQGSFGVGGSLPELAWTFPVAPCDPPSMGSADPLLVGRRHIDLQRVRSAICRRLG